MIKAKLSTIVNPDYIKLRVGMYDKANNLIDEFSNQIFTLKDKALREGLIGLGWLPPDYEVKCPCCGSRYHAEDLRKEDL